MDPRKPKSILRWGLPSGVYWLKKSIGRQNDDGGEALNSQGLQVMVAVVASLVTLGPTRSTAQKHGWTHRHVDTQPCGGGLLWDCLTALCPDLSPAHLLHQILLKPWGIQPSWGAPCTCCLLERAKGCTGQVNPSCPAAPNTQRANLTTCACLLSSQLPDQTCLPHVTAVKGFSQG